MGNKVAVSGEKRYEKRKKANANEQNHFKYKRNNTKISLSYFSS